MLVPVGQWVSKRLPQSGMVEILRALLDVLLCALCVFMLLGSTYNPFIYFRF